MTSFTQASISRSGGKHVAMIAGPNRIRISADDTGHRLTVMECTVPSGQGRQDPVCDRDDRLFIVLKGAFGFWSGDQYVELAQGDCIALPGSIPHRFRNIGTRPERSWPLQRQPPTSWKAPSCVRLLRRARSAGSTAPFPSRFRPTRPDSLTPSTHFQERNHHDDHRREPLVHDRQSSGLPEADRQCRGHVHHRASHGQGFWAAAACSSSRSETFYILEGRFRFQCDGKIIEAGVGDTVHVPKGIVHSFRVISAYGRFLTITRGDFEKMVRAASRPAENEGLPEQLPPTVEQQESLSRLCSAHGIDLLGPPIA